MYENVIESSLHAQAISYFAHSYFAIFQHAIINTIVSAQCTDNTLQLAVVISPTFAPPI